VLKGRERTIPARGEKHSAVIELLTEQFAIVLS
jgi:hypothetical protein